MTQGYHLTKRQKASLRRDIRSGELCASEIARKHDICHDTVGRYAKEIGVTLPPSDYRQVNEWSRQSGAPAVVERRKREAELMKAKSADPIDRRIGERIADLLRITYWQRGEEVIVERRAGVGELVGAGQP